MNGDHGLALIVLAIRGIVRKIEIERGKEIEGEDMTRGIGTVGERDARIVDMIGGIGDTQSAVTRDLSEARLLTPAATEMW